LLSPKFFVCYNLLTHTYFSLQGLILSNALGAQKDAEDEGCTIALSNLRSEVIELRNEGLEKDKILYSLINKIKEDEAAFKGVFGLTFGFGFCPPKSQKPTKGLDPGSSFF
jgi:hypothetical protein